MPKPRYKAVLFDFDGVIVDSEVLNIEIVAQAYRNHGHQFDFTAFAAQAMGQSWDEIPAIIATLSGNANVDTVPKEELLAVGHEIMPNRLRPIEGVHHVLKNMTVPYTIVSNNYRENVLWALNITESARYFDEKLIVTAEQVANPKPAADPYLKAADMLGFDPHDCVVIEDSPIGAAAGVAAGCTVIGFMGGTQTKIMPHGHYDELLNKAGATHLAATMEDVEALLYDK